MFNPKLSKAIWDDYLAGCRGRDADMPLWNESTRRRNTDWYAKQLQEVQTGQGTVKNLRYDAGSLVLDNAALPALVDLLNAAGQPLQSMSVQQDQWKTTQDSLKATLDENDKYLKEQARLTNEIDGAKGVRQQIYREQAKQALIAQEQKDLQPLKINAQVDSQLLIKRQVQLESRVLELKSAASASAK